MSNLSLRLPATLHQEVRELAQKEGISVNQFIMVAVAEKASALRTMAYLQRQTRQEALETMHRILQKVPDVPPLPGDEKEGTVPDADAEP